jgi:hypothetical protein
MISFLAIAGAIFKQAAAVAICLLSAESIAFPAFLLAAQIYPMLTLLATSVKDLT